MLEIRGIENDVNELETNYIKWWQTYERMLQISAEDKTLKAAYKTKLRSLSQGLLDTLQLPNDIASCSYESSEDGDLDIELAKQKHTEYLYAAGMLKSTSHPPSLNVVGYPALLAFLLEQFFSDSFRTIGTLVLPSCFVRPAVIEGVNISLETYLPFTDGPDNAVLMYLTGHGLVSLASLFVRKVVSYHSAKDPLRVFSVGCAYSNFIFPNRCADDCCLSKLDLLTVPQRTKLAVLSICPREEVEANEYTFMKEYIDNLMHKFDLPLKFKRLKAKELYNYESEAESLMYKDIELARISRSGEYIPRRLNIMMKEKEVLHFSFLNYAEIDITSVMAAFLEENIIQKRTDIPDFLNDSYN
uniref:DUF115 domain-containing protein n=1 Tax=Syphacia muris TaxID=451379 RepID=A0A0N5APC2_9BILA